MNRLGTVPSVEANDDQLISAEWVRLNAPARTMAQLIAFTTIQVAAIPYVNITDAGKEGVFIYDASDNTTADNIGTVRVTASGARYKRRYTGDIYSSWFKDDADAAGAARDRAAINRATAFAMAQTVIPEVVVNSGRWYVENDAIYLTPDLGKRLVIKGEPGTVIDFLCTGKAENGTSAVFRTSNNWIWPGGANTVFTGSVTGNVLTVASVTSGTITKHQTVYKDDGSVLPGTRIVAFGTGTGGTGTYFLSRSQTIASGTIKTIAGLAGWYNGDRQIIHGSITIKGITFDGSRNPANNGSNTVFSRAIMLANCQEVNILQNNFVSIPGTGVEIAVADKGKIFGNTFKSVFARNTNDDAGDAITVAAYCKDIKIGGNNAILATGESGRCGIAVDDYCLDCKVLFNDIEGYERAIHGEGSINTIISGNNVSKSPVGIISSQNVSGCIVSNNTIDATNIVFPSTLAATGGLFAYQDNETTFEGNVITGGYTTQNGYYNAKFWGQKLVVKNNTFKNPKLINDYTNSVTSTTPNTVPSNLNTPVSLTFTYSSNTNLTWKLKDRLRAYNTQYIYVEGYITAVSATSVTIQLDKTSGNNTSYSSWTLRYCDYGLVWGVGTQNDNEYSQNIFEYASLEVSGTTNNIVKNNVFKSCYAIAGSSTNVKITNNEFIPNTGETNANTINVYGAVNPQVENNKITNPVDFVIENTSSTGGIFQGNVVFKTSSFDNNYFYVNSALADTGVNRVANPNKIHDYTTDEVFYVGNSGTPYKAFKSILAGDFATSGAYNITLVATGTTNVTLPTSGTLLSTAGVNIISSGMITAGAVTLVKMADVATGTIFYRKTGSTGPPEVQTLATLKTDLGLTGTNSGDQTITLTGEATGSGTGSFAVTLTNSAIIGKTLSGLSIAGSTISSSDTIVQAFGKLQNQINGVLGGAIYQSTWNASTNSPSLTSATGTKGYYYVVSTAGSTNLDGITDWKVGDWAIYNGTAWQKVDNTDAVSSVNSSLGAISLTGTANRLSVSGTVFDIDANYAGQATITTVGTIASGTWNATAIADGKIASALTGKTYNGLTVTTTTGTLTITNGKTASFSNSITISGTDGSTLNVGTGGTLGTGAFATIANYATLASPTFTGTPAAPTATGGTNSTQIATTAFVVSAISGKANLSSPTAGYVPRFTNTSTIGNGVIQDNGTNVGIGGSPTSSKLYVNGTILTNSTIAMDKPSDASQLGLYWTRGGSNRWYLYNSADSATDLILSNYNDSGTYQGDVFKVSRSTGVVQLNYIYLTPQSGPASPTNGTMRYNSGTGKFQGYTGGTWVDFH